MSSSDQSVTSRLRTNGRNSNISPKGSQRNAEWFESGPPHQGWYRPPAVTQIDWTPALASLRETAQSTAYSRSLAGILPEGFGDP